MTDRVRFGKYLRSTLLVSDFVVLNIAYLIALCLTQPDSPFLSRWVWLLANLAFVVSEIIFSEMHSVRILYADRVVLNAFKSTATQFCVFLALVYLFDLDNVTAFQAVIFAGVLFFMLSVWWLSSRTILKRIRRLGFNFKRVIIVGAGKTGQMLFNELRSDSGYGYRLMGFFDDDTERLATARCSFKGDLDLLADFVRLNKIDVIYYTLDAEDNDKILRVMQIADQAGASFIYVPKFNKLLKGQFLTTSVGSMPAMIHTLSPLHKTRNKVAKRILDLVITVPFLIVSPLIFIPIAISIKLTSKGPVFFKQKRTGIYGTEFICYKFRTMRVNAESDTVQATVDDPRKTRVGDFLRRSSLDELPQFFNVLLGNMSIVGPRPHMVSHTEEYSRLIDKYMIRHAVKPGITGWAQVSGYRGGTKHLWQMEKRVEYDVWYIRHWNIFLDLKIIFLTLFNGFRGEKNAY